VFERVCFWENTVDKRKGGDNTSFGRGGGGGGKENSLEHLRNKMLTISGRKRTLTIVLFSQREEGKSRRHHRANLSETKKEGEVFFREGKSRW